MLVGNILKFWRGVSIKGVCGFFRGFRSCRLNFIGVLEVIESFKFLEIGIIKLLK